MNKKVISGILLLFIFICAGFAQQITRFAVVDTSAIFDTFRRDSKSARDYKEKQEKYTAKTKELSDEIVKLRQKKVDAVAANKESVAQKYEEQIKSKVAFLQEYVKACNDELEMLKRDLINDDEFYSSLYEAIKRVAETEGYTMVLTLQQSIGIIWYSPTVDITDKVIQELKK
ncbi:OmpH family outer membrane protein [Treponema pedis]|uniref:Outer membrane protein n=2 Tax=Treponema pedis TaxID=409322 RepID=S6A2N8_9SPIR|nr:OmpH family outer membrane protein [Treponema pedis]AGT42841.1 outer membrane protein [Treponema pedis str. T A4]QOW61460.1 OmpH family outer membrane protein [Treponema pedis]QSI03707.1 OmpH family outer membrane protein [Treponema pedis]